MAQPYYKVIYFEIKDGKATENVVKTFYTGAEVRRYLYARRNTLADFMVYCLLDNTVVTNQFKAYLK